MHPSSEQLKEHVGDILDSPVDQGRVEMIVQRPEIESRTVIESGKLDIKSGLVGDNWLTRGSSSTLDGSANPEAQLTLMNSRVAQAVSGSKDRWSLAGDQLFVDMNLSRKNLPTDSQLSIGGVVLKVTAKPHTGCTKFSDRFGSDSLRFVNIGPGKDNRFRGIYVCVITPGTVKVGDRVEKLPR